MMAKAEVRFYDVEAKTDRSPGDTFEVSQERYDALNGTEYGVLVSQAEDAPKAAPRARKTSRKASQDA